MIKKGILMAAFAAVGLIPAHADYLTHYTITMTGSLAVDGIVKFETVAGSQGVSWPDFIAGSTTSTIDQVFPTTTPRLTALMMGMSYDGYTDPQLFTQSDLAGLTGKHVVMFMSDPAAALAVGQDFNTFFAGYDEATVIDWLEVVGQIGDPPIDDTTFNADVDNLAGLAAYAQTHYSAYFTIPADQISPPGTFSAVQFSTGGLVGTGLSTQTLTATAPEPGTVALLGLGLAAVWLRRKASKA